MRKAEENIKFVKSLIPSAIALLGIWGVFVLEKYLPFSLVKYGIYPRTLFGLKGILFSPFIHGDLTHVLGNSLPLAVLLFYLSMFYRNLFLRIVLWSVLMTGFWVWASARPSYHIGASGVIYALLAFLFFSGIIRQNRTLLVVSLTVAFFYGSLFWGIFPLEQKVSWESHLCGAISGAVLAIYYRKVGYQRTLYPWQTMSEKDYLAENIQLYGDYYWDPLKQEELQRKQEHQNSTALGDYKVIYHFKPGTENNGNS